MYIRCISPFNVHLVLMDERRRVSARGCLSSESLDNPAILHSNELAFHLTKATNFLLLCFPVPKPFAAVHHRLMPEFEEYYVFLSLFFGE